MTREWEYQRIARELRGRIMRGEVRDKQILTVAKLSREYGVDRSVIAKAMWILQREGHVSSAPTGRRFIAHHAEIPSDPADVAAMIVARLDAILRDLRRLKYIEWKPR